MEMPVFVVGCYCSCEIGGDWRGLHKRLNVRGTRSFSSFLVVVVVVVSGMGGGRQRREVVVFLVVVGVGAGEDRDQQQRGGGWAGLDLAVRSWIVSSVVLRLGLLCNEYHGGMEFTSLFVMGNESRYPSTTLAVRPVSHPGAPVSSNLQP
jgi:hypothetical protein